MKHFILCISLLATHSVANTYTLSPLSITKDITCFIGDFNPPTKSNKGFVSNVCYIDMGDSIVVIDPGPTYLFAKELHQQIQKTHPDKKVSHVIVTNFHDDRLLGASYFQEIGIKIVGHKTINEDIQKYQGKFERIQKITTKAEYAGTKIIKADTLVDGGYTIKGSRKTLEIIKPSKVSEERSDIAVYCKEDSFLFAGNIIFNGRMLNYREASSINGWIEALENLKKRKAKYILGGHGKEYDTNSYRFSLEYLKVLKEDVSSAYKNEIEREDVKKTFRSKAFEKMPYFQQLNSNNINKYYDQLEWAE